MSTSRLDQVTSYDEFGFDHWKALGTILGGPDVVKAILRREIEVKVDCLPEMQHCILPASRRSPRRFFTRQNGIFPTDRFRELVLGKDPDTLVSVKGTSAGFLDMRLRVNNSRAHAELPPGHQFEDRTALAVHLAQLISDQWDGEEGVLAVTGQNAFFCKGEPGRVDVVIVITRTTEPDFTGWLCEAMYDHQYGLHDETRLFSAAPVN